MNKKFVKTTLLLSAIFIMAFSTQAFAAGTYSGSTKVNVKLNDECLNMVNEISQKINKADLQKIFQDCNIKISNKINRSSAPRMPKAPVEAKKPVAPAPIEKPAAPAPEKPEAPAKPVPSVPKAPAEPKAPAPAKPAEPKAPAPAKSAANIGSYEQQVVDLVNSERAKVGLPALKMNTKLAGVAEKKAEDLRDNNYFAHNSPTYGSPFDMMRQFGVTYTTAGENIARGQKTPAAVMNGWMNSQGHKENILNSNFTEIGVGYVTDSNGTTYWVQMFIRP
ncbi:MAG: CAP domain-containing protein [Anaerovoracaceae bacterium]|jgi:uncharacterized YkwD family protein